MKELNAVIKNRESRPFGFDHNYRVGPVTSKPREIVNLSHPPSGRKMTILSDQAGIQCYTGNWIDNIPGKNKSKYMQWQGVALETQCYPDAITIGKKDSAEFKEGQCFILRPGGKPYKHQVVYKFGTC